MKPKWLVSLAVVLLAACDLDTSVGDPKDGGIEDAGGTGLADGGDGGAVGVDAGDGEATDAGPGSPKRLFVTYNLYNGDLKTAGGGVDGPDGADKLCALAAASVNLGGQWKAWLSTSTVDAIDRINDVGPWRNLKGGIVFNNKANILTGALTPIEYGCGSFSETGLSRETARLSAWREFAEPRIVGPSA